MNVMFVPHFLYNPKKAKKTLLPNHTLVHLIYRRIKLHCEIVIAP